MANGKGELADFQDVGAVEDYGAVTRWLWILGLAWGLVGAGEHAYGLRVIELGLG